MCGLFGFIGESKNPQITENLSTALFVKTQTRGTDASGFYCVETFPKKQIAYYKKPIPASEFINLNEYKKIWQHNWNLGLFHCRAASAGVGIPAYNENNHPFVSTDLKKAVIHNGLIAKQEYELLRKYYELETECDSEILLRIFEQDEKFQDNAKKFFHYGENSHYAVVFAETDENYRKMHLFRNMHRPLVLVDLLDELGQVFFCSTSDIFFDSLSLLDKELKNVKIYEIPQDSYIELSLQEENKIDLKKYQVAIEKNGKKPELSFKSICKNTSEWKNILSTKNIEEVREILSKMSHKLVGQANLIEQQLNKENNKLKDKQKINQVFSNLRDMNKRCELILKSLGES